VSCPNKPGEGLCLTCRLGGLIRCPSLGTPLPLAEAEKPKVVYSRRSSRGRRKTPW
jgi:hypothetical protein